MEAVNIGIPFLPLSYIQTLKGTGEAHYYRLTINNSSLTDETKFGLLK